MNAARGLQPSTGAERALSAAVSGVVRSPTLAENARELSKKFALPHADDVDAQARFPHEAIDALKGGRLLSAGVAVELGGAGAGVGELSAICEALGQHCASTAMIYAMHLIQVACVARHHGGSPLFTAFLAEVADQQLLLGSVTSEVGVGGETRASIACFSRRDGRFSVEKEATTISYGAQADALLLTARASPAAARNDQALALLRRPDYTLEQRGIWDTLGMRGTCSPAFRVVASADEAQLLPVPFDVISAETMVPFSHVLWSSCWLGIATAALARAPPGLRARARPGPGPAPCPPGRCGSPRPPASSS